MGRAGTMVTATRVSLSKKPANIYNASTPIRSRTTKWTMASESESQNVSTLTFRYADRLGKCAPPLGHSAHSLRLSPRLGPA